MGNTVSYKDIGKEVFLQRKDINDTLIRNKQKQRNLSPEPKLSSLLSSRDDSPAFGKRTLNYYDKFQEPRRVFAPKASLSFAYVPVKRRVE